MVDRKKLKEFCGSILESMIRLYCPVSKHALCADMKWIDKIYRKYVKLIRHTSKITLFIFLKPYAEAVKSLISAGEIDEETYIAAYISHFKESNDDIKYFMSKIIYCIGLLNDDLCREIMAFAYGTANRDDRYWTAMDISKITFLLQKGFYPEYYNDRKKLLQKIAAEGNYQTAKRKSENDAGRVKLCIVTYQLADTLTNTMQRVATMMANAMCQRADEVLVVSLESFSVSQKEQNSITTFFRASIASENQTAITAMFDSRVQVGFIEGDTYAKRCQKALDRIYAFAPDAIIDISDEYSAVSYIYSKDYPTYYLPLRNVATSSGHTKLLGLEWQYAEGNERFHDVDLKKVASWAFPEYVPSMKKKRSKADIGVPEQAFVILSIGNNEHGFSTGFEDMMCRLLEKQNDMVWLMVGTDASANIKTNRGELLSRRKIIAWGYESDLAGLCCACDIHLRSDITGGSGATAIAAMQGLPIVMRDSICDPMRWLGRDFSALHTDEEIIAEIERLYLDQNYWQKQSAVAKEKVSKATDAEYWWNELYRIVTEDQWRGDR